MGYVSALVTQKLRFILPEEGKPIVPPGEWALDDSLKPERILLPPCSEGDAQHCCLKSITTKEAVSMESCKDTGNTYFP